MRVCSLRVLVRCWWPVSRIEVLLNRQAPSPVDASGRGSPWFRSVSQSGRKWVICGPKVGSVSKCVSASSVSVGRESQLYQVSVRAA